MRLLPIAAYKLIKILERIGFQVIRQKGSHAILRHPDGRVTVVPVHAGREIDPHLLSRILREIKVTREEFMKILKQIIALLHF